MKKIIRWIWQLPQNLLGFLLTRKYQMKSRRKMVDGYVNVWFKPFFRAGVSLGDYIILDKWYIGREAFNTVAHEHGHQKQSLMLGWLYLVVVGLPSLCNNIWDRLFHKQWTEQRRNKWYYSRYPERWADILGGVIRD